ncbi:hypothetical protein ACS8YF_15725, partial [Salinisphaera sp. SWV1]|uniref:hypothetical protein n=1 Tax=Salinisphaera sp. SWV1 TaxID=3454139 RepID=UPI003F854B31
SIDRILTNRRRDNARRNGCGHQPRQSCTRHRQAASKARLTACFDRFEVIFAVISGTDAIAVVVCEGLLPFRASAALETANRVRQGASRRSWRATIKASNAAGRP